MSKERPVGWSPKSNKIQRMRVTKPESYKKPLLCQSVWCICQQVFVVRRQNGKTKEEEKVKFIQRSHKNVVCTVQVGGLETIKLNFMCSIFDFCAVYVRNNGNEWLWCRHVATMPCKNVDNKDKLISSIFLINLILLSLYISWKKKQFNLI